MMDLCTNTLGGQIIAAIVLGWLAGTAFWFARRRLPRDVVRLVIAAREVAFGDISAESLRELDTASESFASRVRWNDEP